ncbi:MAG: hypothetical protein WBE76_14430 [Terracidiphilus sp.]
MQSKTQSEDFKYDVAISFLVQDISLAASLNEKLSDGLEVFFFPRRQEELAGTDGLESMREAFRHESRLNVVLYRPKWGNTPWTAVEAAAIKDCCLANAYRSLFFFVIESTTLLPTWLPESHVYFSSAHYSIDQAVGAIKARVQERGGHYKPLTPLRKAELNRTEEDYRRAKSYMSSSEGLTKIFLKVKELFEEICRQCDEVNAAGPPQIRYQVQLKEGIIEQICTLAGPRVGMLVIWFQRFGNSLDNALLGVREFNKNMIIPPGNIRMDQPEMVSETKYDPDLSRALEYGWKPQRGQKGFISSKELASQCVIQFLDLMNRDAEGKVRRKSRY